jgi:hypothetical protein
MTSKESPVSSPVLSSANRTVPTAHPKVAKLVPFLRKVQQLCESAPSHIARWSADGKQFDVLDAKGFDDLLKVHFEGAAPATFHRQLFFYGWVKLNHSNGGGDEKTKGTWSFRHPCFLRDEPSKIYEIKRYARASDREEQEDGTRVDILERRVSALQSLVDDLSRKLAAVQLTLDRTPLAVAPAAPKAVADKSGRKRVKDEQVEDELFDEEFRLSEEDLVNLFDSDMMIIEEEVQAEEAQPAVMASKESDASLSLPRQAEPQTKQSMTKTFKVPTEEEKQAQQAHGFISSIMSTPQFQMAITSKTMQDKSMQEKSSTAKVQALPHLSVF